MPHSLPRLIAVLLAIFVAATAISVPAAASGADASVRLDPRYERGGEVPDHFVGLSVEWSLVERYMSPSARPAFVNLLRNLDTGVLRIGGSSQDLTPFDATAPNTNRVVTPEDLAYIRSTLDATGRSRHGLPPWGVVLGTAMSPPSDSRPFVSPEHARRFVTQGVAPAFPGEDARKVVGIELGNEPDLSYKDDLERYLGDLTTYAADGVTGPYPVIAPNTSEDILPWQSVQEQSVPTRYFWDWPRILDTSAVTMNDRAGPFGAYASDHFYPLARTCTGKPYRCPSIPALLSDEHMQSLDHQAYVHSRMAARHDLGYRLEETNTAAGRGADGVSNRAASTAYALDLMFRVACPQPPHRPGANASCGVGGTGVNFHNAEVRAFYEPEEGNAYYNAIDYDPGTTWGAPTADPLYYAMLLFARFAQGAQGLRPVEVTANDPATSQVKAWRVRDGAATRLFLVNKSDRPFDVAVGTPASRALVDRMTPYDPTGAGRTLDAPAVRIDGRAVSADGSWPGFLPTVERTHGGRLAVDLAPGEAAVVSVHAHE